MRLTNTDEAEDRIIEQCEEFGGVAAELSEITERLDDALTKALERIEYLESEIRLLS
jgi:hypothetical protein